MAAAASSFWWNAAPANAWLAAHRCVNPDGPDVAWAFPLEKIGGSGWLMPDITLPDKAGLNADVIVDEWLADFVLRLALVEAYAGYSEPADFPYGERQYTAEDPAGHQWTFSETLADVAPEEWGGTWVTPGQ